MHAYSAADYYACMCKCCLVYKGMGSISALHGVQKLLDKSWRRLGFPGKGGGGGEAL